MRGVFPGQYSKHLACRHSHWRVLTTRHLTRDLSLTTSTHTQHPTGHTPEPVSCSELHSELYQPNHSRCGRKYDTHTVCACVNLRHSLVAGLNISQPIPVYDFTASTWRKSPFSRFLLQPSVSPASFCFFITELWSLSVHTCVFIQT